MSSNNQLLITKEGKKFKVYHNSCVDNEFIPSKDDLLKGCKTLIDAIKFANEYCLKEIVEYGYYISYSCLGEK